MRDFTFVPDNGRITHLSYDTFGVPSIPEALLNVFEVGALFGWAAPSQSAMMTSLLFCGRVLQAGCHGTP